ncbi:dihydrolipoyl dehydrogenase [Haliangium ochraceum]|uniref:Dihydrolipoyl dehydrogenase n=1 Tax=Haliangium ochraceum (strain DSM 14365 / JCM 11303 / SMP-2) TaxID=502025 RepID=D0LVC4_HALO1|nr:dihydrolipoyl dehydrogenase [Haliangium ochraceum]ACY17485.1 dihydrolipoamide dehydrogenase [Haliangium ochraceum DSM 14365]
MPKHDMIVIGAGPGGYVAAIRAAQLGLDVASVEREAALGGTCVRVGCIPSKALLESSERYHEAKHGLSAHGIEVGEVGFDLGAMMARKDKVVKSNCDGVAYLFKKNQVTRYRGHAEIQAPGKVVVHADGEDQVLEAEHIVIATGSSVAKLRGVEPDGDRIGTSTEALAYPEVPERLVVIGAGYIGLELGSVWQRLGSQVTVLEYMDRILPGMDAEIAADALKVFKKQGLQFHLGARVTGAALTDAGDVEVQVDGMEPLRCDRVLLATGRSPNTEGLGLDAVGVACDERGRVTVDERFRTNVEGIYAIGDVIAGPMLAHKAEEEGVALAEMIVTGHGHVDYDTVPGIVYTEPEIATVGKTEEQLKEAGVAYAKGVFPYQANGRARALGATEGKVKVLADERSDRILGVHIIGSRAGDLIAEAVAAMTFGASSEDLARTMHAHPTLSEILKEAALGVAKRAIHI